MAAGEKSIHHRIAKGSKVANLSSVFEGGELVVAAEIKPIADLNRTLLSEAVPLETPFSVYAFVSNACNFKCVYCAHSLGMSGMQKRYDFDSSMMRLETFRKMVDQLKEFPQKVKVLSLTGQGEPLLNLELPAMIAYAKEKDVAERVEFISNASLLTHEVADALIDVGLDALRISIQGMSAEKYREVCAFDLDFDRFIENIRYFYEHKKNCTLFIKVIDIALDDGDDERFYQTFSPICDRMYIEQCRPVYSGVPMTDGIDTSADRYGVQHESRIVCPLCFFQLCVLPSGDVKPCDAIYRPVIMGNLHEQSLQSLWNGAALQEFQIMQLQKQRHAHSVCQQCCAPDDVAHSADALDDAAEEVLLKIKSRRVL